MDSYILTAKQRDAFIAAFTPELATLRTKADVSQEELAHILGVTRQTYNAIECKSRKMSWSTYLALMFFYDHNKKTHKLLRNMNIFPYDLISSFNGGQDTLELEVSDLIGKGSEDILKLLDEQAIRTIKIVALAEYARCAELSAEAAIKSFDELDLKKEEKKEVKPKKTGRVGRPRKNKI